MKVRIYSDETIDIRLDEISQNLNRLAPSFNFIVGRAEFYITSLLVMCPETYRKLNPKIIKESANDDVVLLFTEMPYDNNYFWEPEGNKVILSLSGWDHLTSLSRNNGAVYFICAILTRFLGVGLSHRDKNTGCINDFWQDKTGVDSGMRCAFVCEKCLHSFKRKTNKREMALLQNIQEVLNVLSDASRAGIDICDFWTLQKKEKSFDVFICHNSEEKDLIRKMNCKLQKSGIVTWFDEEQLPPGQPWQELLEEQIGSIKTAAVFVGDSGIGPWQNREIRALLGELVNRKCPVIPVILPSCQSVPKLPIFLSQL